ncbi:MAG: serine hydrolase [Cyclobacteriaceae bacterium]|nr:serine hydrolase [Cyclobacteriaceae bacterium]
MTKKVVLLAMFILMGITTFSQSFHIDSRKQEWVDSTFNKLSKNERLAQLYVLPIDGDSSIGNLNTIKSLLQKHQVGGVYFSNSTPSNQVAIINDIQQITEIPILISMDSQYGLHNYVPQAYKYPTQTTLAAVKNPVLIAQMQQHIQEQLSILGVNFPLSGENSNSSPLINDLDRYQLGINQMFTNSEKENLIFMFSSNNIELSIKMLKKYIRKKTINGQDIDNNIKRILKAKYTILQENKQLVNPDNLLLKLKRPKYEVLLEKLYQSATTIHTSELLPFQMLDTSTFASITLGGNADIINAYLSRYTQFAHFKNEKNREQLIDKLSSFSTVVANILTPNQLTDESYQFLETLSNKTNLVVCYYGEISEKHQLFKNSIEAHENNTYTQKIVPQFLFGAIPTHQSTLHRLGYSIPEAVGIDSYVLRKIDEIAKEAIANKATPGCQILIAKEGKVIFDKNYGFYTYDSLRPVTTATIYDIASITKVAATLQAILFMNENGLLDLDYKISYYLPELKDTNKENMTIRDILTHQAGLKSWLPFWKNTMEGTSHLPDFYSYHPQDNYPHQVSEGLYAHTNMEDKVWQWIVESDLRTKKDRTPFDYTYSDMGYYMLFHLVEKTLNQPIEDFLSQNMYEPLGANRLNYLPLCKFPADQIAPTENDLDFRNIQIVGTAHDQGAAMLGGVAGHAGLFSNANDLAKLFQMHLQDGSYGGINYFSKKTLDKFRHPQYKTSRRGAGWDKPIPGAWYGATGENVSLKTFGHTGFTGTAAWVDPEFDLVYIFLSNRVYPDATNNKLYQTNIRTRIQDIIYEAIWSYCDKND